MQPTPVPRRRARSSLLAPRNVRRLRRLLVEPLEDRSLLSVQPLVFGGIDDSVASPTNAGLTLAADLASGEQMPLFAYEAIRSEGISGIAFLPDGRLFGTTTDGPGSSSSLIEIDPATGVELSRVAISGGISIGDLAVRPGTSTLYAVRSDHDGADRGGEIYTLSTAGTATLVGGPVSDGEVGGLAFADADTLYYATTPAVNVRMLLELDADTLSVQSSKRLSGNEPLSGLAYWAEMDALVGSGGPDGSLVEIDPATGARSPIALQAPARGIWGDLDFQPDPETLRQIYHEDFEDGNGQYTPVNDHPRDLPGYWHFSLGRFRDQLLNHSVSHSWYYGQFETPTGGGNYPVLQSHKGVLISDQIELCDSGTSILSFSYLLDTRPALDVDIVEVYVEHNGGLTLIKDRAGGSLPRTGGDLWLTSTENISEFNGQTIRIHFLFDTGEAPPLDPEGWYVDDVQITCLEDVERSIEWEKRDAAGENLLLGGATFQITPNPYTGTGTLDVVDNGPYDQDPDGGQFKVTKVTINDVVMYVLADDYEIKETVAPPGYAKDPDPRMVTVSDANPNAVVGTQGDVDKKQNEEDTNYDFFNVLYSIEWEKRDASGENLLLGGATFQITPNPYTGTGTLDVVDNGPYDQDPDGGQFKVTKVTINDVVMYVLADDYEIKETVAPPGYAKDPDPRMVTVSDANPNAVVGEQDEIDQKENEEDQDYDFFNEPIEIAPPAQTVQFITPMSFWRSAGPFDPDTDGDTKPSTGTASIGGYLWNDNDQDGTWDAGERGRGGWLVFIDANDDGSLDPVTERFAVTEFDDPGTAANEAGRYELAGLAAGTYTVAVARTGLSDGTFRMLTFPDADPTTGRHTFEVELADGQTVQGDREQTELPNFGSFDYSPFIRPADDVLGHYQLYFGNAADQNRFVTALSGTETRPWQTFDVANNTGSNLNLDSIMVEVAAVTGASLSEFRQNIVSVFLMENGAIVGNELTANASGVIDLSSLSLTLEPGETQEFFVFYNPGFWDAAHASVSAQYPDWYDDPNTAEDESSTRPPHTFGNDDHLEVITSFDASSATPPSYRVDLVGGSTYDSDIFYDGLVVLDDYRLIDDVLRDNWPTVVGDSDFDPTKDINARFPNGAEDDKEPDPWPLAGPPAREIGLGDFGPFNVEHDLNAPQQGRARAPFLDLDPDNDSRVLGVNFQTQFSGEAVPVSDTDASFANAEVLLLQSLIVDVLDPQTGDVVSFPESLTRTVDTKIVVSFPAGTIGNAERLNTNIVVDQLSGPALTFQRDTSINSTTFPGELFSDSEVLVFIEVARNVLFDAASSAPERDVVVRFRSTGTDEDFGSQTDGNTAKTTVHIVPTSIAFENRTEGGELLGGATFTLEPDPATGSGSLEVVDDVDDVTSESDVDRDPRPGSVLVEPVEPGAYTITQTTAPAGYDLDDDVDRAIVVNSPGEAVVVGTQGADDPGNADTSDFHNPVTAEPVEAEMQAALAAIDMDPAIGFWATAAIQESASDGSRDSSPDGPDVPSATVEVDGAETTPEQALLESPAELELAIEEMLEDVDSVDVVFAELGAE